MRRHRNTAADVGALIEFFSLQVLDPLPEAAAQQTSERAREIEAHLACEAEDLSDSGLSTSEARGAARRAFGNPLQRQEEIGKQNRRVEWKARELLHHFGGIVGRGAGLARGRALPAGDYDMTWSTGADIRITVPRSRVLPDSIAAIRARCGRALHGRTRAGRRS